MHWLVETSVYDLIERQASEQKMPVDDWMKALFIQHIEVEQLDNAPEVLTALIHVDFVTVSVLDHGDTMRLVLLPDQFAGLKDLAATGRDVEAFSVGDLTCIKIYPPGGDVKVLQ